MSIFSGFLDLLFSEKGERVQLDRLVLERASYIGKAVIVEDVFLTVEEHVSITTKPLVFPMRGTGGRARDFMACKGELTMKGFNGEFRCEFWIGMEYIEKAIVGEKFFFSSLAGIVRCKDGIFSLHIGTEPAFTVPVPQE